MVTFVNRVQQTIWVAASPDPAHPLAAMRPARAPLRASVTTGSRSASLPAA